MKPTKKNEQFGDFFSPWLKGVLSPEHRLYKLANKINWKPLEDDFSNLFVEDKGAPAKPVRLVIGIMMLQHMFGYSDESVVEMWIENPYWQFFCGEEKLQCGYPIHFSSLSRWRKRLGPVGMEKILQNTIDTALKTGAIKKKSQKGNRRHNSDGKKYHVSY